MKPKYTLSLAFYFLIFFCVVAQKNETANKRHIYESVKIEYEITGDSQGNAVLITADYGWKEKWEHKFDYSIYGISSKEHKVEIRERNTIYLFDMIARKGRKKTDTKTKALVSYKSPLEIPQALLTSEGGKLDRTDTLLGKSVNVWKFENQPTKEIWEWSGYVLREVKKLGKLEYSITATSIELAAGNSADEFVLPENISFN